MNRSLVLFAIVGALALPSTLAAQAELRAHTFEASPDTTLNVLSELHGASGHRYLLLAAQSHPAGFDWMHSARVAIGSIDVSGRGSAAFRVSDPSTLPDGLVIDLVAVYLDDADRVVTSSVISVPITRGSDCELLDMDFTIGTEEPQTGQIIDDEWALMGLQISAKNNNPVHPDLAIIFDSANPTGGDDDLRTPGSGLGNDIALGKLLIIPESDFDGDADGRVDVPDDEAWGGTIRFDFADPVTLCSITLVDIDDNGSSEIVFTRSDASQTTTAIPNAGNNSVQKLGFLAEDVVRMDVVFGGSGGIAELELVTCPVLRFDESTTGIPNGLKAGLEITDQFFAEHGILIEAENHVAGHPDKAILFDSGNPTGGDQDLVTPGPGLGNDTALGMILIIAEDDVDANSDGLVDDPDDEAGGGIMRFTWNEDVDFVSLTVLDVDGTEVDSVNVFDAADQLLAHFDLVNLGENSVQKVTASPRISGVRKVEVLLGGSGGVARLTWCPPEVQ